MPTKSDNDGILEALESVDWRRIQAMSDDEIEAAALADPDNPPATDEALAEAVERRRRRLSRDAAE